MKSNSNGSSVIIAQAERIRILEQSIRDQIEFLRSLPIHPRTHHQAAAAEYILNDKQVSINPPNYECEKFGPTGVLLLKTTLNGSSLTVKTQSLDNYDIALKNKLTQDLYNALHNGLVMDLK